MLELSPTTNEIFMVTSDVTLDSSGVVRRMEVIPYAYRLTINEAIYKVGDYRDVNVHDIAVSNDGERIAIASDKKIPTTYPELDRNLYSIYDYSATDFTNKNAGWAIHGIPNSVDFSVILIFALLPTAISPMILSSALMGCMLRRK